MPCSRMPKCSVRPYGLPGHISDWRLTGRKDGSPSIVVLLDSARSAEPPHSSGSTGASAVRILPDVRRVPVPFGSAGKTGSAASHPSGRDPEDNRAKSDPRSGFSFSQAANCESHSACRALPREATSRARLSASSSTGKFTAGSKPRISLVAATSASPSAEPCAAPVFCLVGAGQPMIVRSTMSDGLSVTALAARMASYSAWGSSWYPVPVTQSTCCTCQP